MRFYFTIVNKCSFIFAKIDLYSSILSSVQFNCNSVLGIILIE